MRTLLVRSADPRMGEYEYTPSSESDAKAVQSTLRALGAQVSTIKEEEGTS